MLFSVSSKCRLDSGNSRQRHCVLMTRQMKFSFASHNFDSFNSVFCLFKYPVFVVVAVIVGSYASMTTSDTPFYHS